MAKIAVFGGSFDPPHYGHTNLLVCLKETYGIDEVLVIPACLNPLKPPVASPEQRLAMCHLHFDDVPGCSILDFEVRRPTVSYTVDTLRWLMKYHRGFEQAERFVLLGADVIPSLPQWKEVDEIFSLARPLIAARGEVDPRLVLELTPVLLQAVRDGWTDTGLFDISSTAVRDRLRRWLYVEHLVKESVVRYIHSSHIYQEEPS